jgi:hypothetical protein
MLLAPDGIANDRWIGRRVGVRMTKELPAVMRAVTLSIAVTVAAFGTECANGSSQLTGPSPLAVTTPSVPSSCTVPGAPSRLSADVEGDAVSLSWSSVTDASDYVVLVGWTPISSESVLTNTSESHYSINDLPSGTHYARVHAHNWCGTSGASEPITFTVQ